MSDHSYFRNAKSKAENLIKEIVQDDHNSENDIELEFDEEDEYKPDNVKSNFLDYHTTCMTSVSPVKNADASNETSYSEISISEEIVVTGKRNSRKKLRTPVEWSKNKRSRDYNTGKVRTFLNLTRSRSVQGTCVQCRQKCYEKISVQEQEEINIYFWNVGSSEKRRHFITGNTNYEVKKSSRGVTARRATTIIYFLPVRDLKIKVCKTFFLKTLDISEQIVFYANKKILTNGINIPNKKNEIHNKTSGAKVNLVNEHINKFPKMESHFTRKDSKREYLEAGLTLKEMYRLYVAWMKEQQNNNMMVSEGIYRKIFNENYNLGFFQPSKDQCGTCIQHSLKEKTNSLEENDRIDYKLHLERKEQARSMKGNDKSDKNIKSSVASFDLQQVLLLPKLHVGDAYYSRKLNCYNLTIMNMKNKQGYCFVWPESEGGRGSNEIASSIWNWMLKEDKDEKTQIILYSDTCSGQNRNRIFCTMVIIFLSRAKNIKTVHQKFFEPGHSFMECDSMHACIEKEIKNREIYLPSGLISLMKSACKSKPYEVFQEDHTKAYDFEKLNKELLKKDAFAGIQSIRWIESTIKDNDVIVYFRDQLDSSRPAVEKKFLRRGIKMSRLKTTPIPRAYNAKLEIDSSKKTDLLKLCTYMPTDTTSYYESL